MKVRSPVPKMQVIAALLCLIGTLALFPAGLLAYVGAIWFPDVDPPSKISAAAMVAGPIPLAIAAFLSWEAAVERDSKKLLKAAAFTLAALALYVLAWVWGGRMFL